MDSRPLLEPQRIVVPLYGALTNEVAHRLRDQLMLGIDYYRYDTVAIRIDSPGGDLGALEMLAGELDTMRLEHGIRVQTEIVGMAASAAALIAALGCIGHRSARSTSRIMLHEPRLMSGPSQRQWTRSDLESIGQTLTTAYERQLSSLTSHVWANLPRAGRCPSEIITSDEGHVFMGEGDLLGYYRDLMTHESWMTASEAYAAGLIDHVSGTMTNPAVQSSYSTRRSGL